MVQFKEQLSIKIAKWIYDEAMIREADNKTARIEELLIKGIMHEKREEMLINSRKSSQPIHNSPVVLRGNPYILENHPVAIA